MEQIKKGLERLGPRKQCEKDGAERGIILQTDGDPPAH